MSNNRVNFRGNPLEVIGFLDDVTSDLGGWISNGTPPAGSIPDVVQGRYRDACDSWSNGLQWTTALSPQGRLVMSNICKPWLDSQGSGDPVSQPPDEPWKAYEGQDLTQYCGVRLRVFSYFFGTFSQEDVIEYHEVPPEPPSLNFVLEFTRCDGTTGLFANIRDFTPNQGSNIQILSTGVCPGCSGGDPLPTPDPVPGPNPNPRPDPGLDPEDEPFPDPTGRPVIPMPGIDDPFGDPIQIPNLPLPNVEGPSLFPEGESPPNPESDPGTPDEPVDIPAGDEAEGTCSDGRELVGVKLEFTQVPGKPRQPGNVIGPQLYIGGAYVFMGLDGQGLELQGEGSLIESGQFFFATRPSNKWRVIAALGYAVKVTPYCREVEE